MITVAARDNGRQPFVSRFFRPLPRLLLENPQLPGAHAPGFTLKHASQVKKQRLRRENGDQAQLKTSQLSLTVRFNRRRALSQDGEDSRILRLALHFYFAERPHIIITFD